MVQNCSRSSVHYLAVLWIVAVALLSIVGAENAGTSHQIDSSATRSDVPNKASVGSEPESKERVHPVIRNNHRNHPRARLVQGRGFSSVLTSFDPLGILKSATRMVRKGVNVFRESLQEGVKVAQMLKEDVDEGVTHIWGQKHDNKEESEAGDETKASTEESVFESHSFKQQSPLDSQALREGMLGGILRFMNVDSSRLGIIALNVLIFVAEMITSSLLGKDNSIADSRVIKDNLMEWVTKGHNKLVDGLLKDATKETLPDSLIETLQDKTGNSTSCVQLLLCKLTPIIWGVQKTVDKQMNNLKDGKNNDKDSSKSHPRASNLIPSNIMDNILSNVPTADRFVDHGDKCEKRFPNCRLLKFSKQS